MRKNKLNHPKKSLIFLLAILFINIPFTGCIEEGNEDTLGVLITIVPQQEMLEKIGGEHIEITILVPPGESPHTYEPTPEQMLKVASAEAYFIVGSGVEFELNHLDAIQEQNNNLEIIDCSASINITTFNGHYTISSNVSTNQTANEGTDPHIWTSPANYRLMAQSVYEGLIELDPTHQDYYYNNYLNYSQELIELHNNITQLLEPYNNSLFMVYHPAWGYFGDTYSLQQIAIEDDGKEPGPAGVAAIIDQANDENITIIFVSPQFDTTSAETIAEAIDGHVVFANPLMTNYSETLLQLTDDIISGYTP